MGWVMMETITDDNARNFFEMETDSLYNICFPSGNQIRSMDMICQICVTADIIVIRTEDRDLRDGRQHAPFAKNNRCENNINAYDHDGNHLWNIGQIVGDIKMAFDGFTHITARDVKERFGIKIKRKQKNLFSCSAGGFVFIIDAAEPRMLYKIAGMVK